MRYFLLALLLLPASAFAIGIGGPGVVKGGSSGVVPPDAPRCDFAYQLPGVSGGEYVCNPGGPGWPVTTTRAGGATCIDGHTVGVDEACISAGGLECFASGVGGRTAADVHTVSTAGWPVASGRIDFQFTGTPPASPVATIFDTRSPATGLSGMVLYVNTSGWRLQFADATTAHAALIGPPDTAEGSYAGSIQWDAAGVSITINGVTTSHPGAQVMNAHHSAAVIGSNRVGANPANGSIRLLRVSP